VATVLCFGLLLGFLYLAGGADGSVKRDGTELGRSDKRWTATQE
jgi:hypothetical protein